MVFRSVHNQDEGDLETGTRVCVACKERKSMTEYFWAGRKYRRRKCKKCVVEYARDRRKVAGVDEVARKRAGHLRREFGLTEAGYKALVKIQQGKCAICRSNFTIPHVDHDHRSGRIRGLLCFKCNTALGKFNDDPELLHSAILYIEREPPDIETRERRLTALEVSAAHRAGRSRPSLTRSLLHSLAIRGESSPLARLTEVEVLEIRERYIAGNVTQSRLGEEFGISQSAISLIVRGINWRHLTDRQQAVDDGG